MKTSLFSLEDKIALVTGGNGGLGLSMALALKNAGATVYISGRNKSKNAEARKLGLKSIQMDVRKECDVEEAINSIIDKERKLDILVNNAGIYRDQHIIEIDEASWHDIMDTNLTGTLLCTKHFAKHVKRIQNNGKIINIGSMYSIFGHLNSVGYCSSKTGVIGITRASSVELGGLNIQVNAISPGWFKTEMNGNLPEEERGNDIRSRTPAARWGVGEDLAGVIVFLASNGSDFITGADIVVDGGYHLSDRKIY